MLKKSKLQKLNEKLLQLPFEYKTLESLSTHVGWWCNYVEFGFVYKAKLIKIGSKYLLDRGCLPHADTVQLFYYKET